VEFSEVVRRRAMVRSFDSAPLPVGVVDQIVAAALRAPSAGNTGGTAWVVLSGPAETALYWDSATDEAWRSGTGSSRFPGLRRAPVVLLAYSSASAYVARYAEPDKSPSSAQLGLGDSAESWPVPYWTGDAAFGVMSALLAAVDAGVGACVLGNFRGELALASSLGVPDEWRLFCAVLLGRSDGADHASPSLSRPGPALSDRVHRGRW
jgi:nitroreductase